MHRRGLGGGAPHVPPKTVVKSFWKKCNHWGPLPFYFSLPQVLAQKEFVKKLTWFFNYCRNLTRVNLQSLQRGPTSIDLSQTNSLTKLSGHHFN
jgi:hypothetical protein